MLVRSVESASIEMSSLFNKGGLSSSMIESVSTGATFRAGVTVCLDMLVKRFDGVGI